MVTEAHYSKNRPALCIGKYSLIRRILSLIGMTRGRRSLECANPLSKYVGVSFLPGAVVAVRRRPAWSWASGSCLDNQIKWDRETALKSSIGDFGIGVSNIMKDNDDLQEELKTEHRGGNNYKEGSKI